MVRINMITHREFGREMRIREYLRCHEMMRELVAYAGIFCSMTTVACAFWLVQAWG